jgi:hypothetical protein
VSLKTGFQKYKKDITPPSTVKKAVDYQPQKKNINNTEHNYIPCSVGRRKLVTTLLLKKKFMINSEQTPETLSRKTLLAETSRV